MSDDKIPEGAPDEYPSVWEEESEWDDSEASSFDSVDEFVRQRVFFTKRLPNCDPPLSLDQKQRVENVRRRWLEVVLKRKLDKKEVQARHYERQQQGSLISLALAHYPRVHARLRAEGIVAGPSNVSIKHRTSVTDFLPWGRFTPKLSRTRITRLEDREGWHDTIDAFLILDPTLEDEAEVSHPEGQQSYYDTLPDEPEGLSREHAVEGDISNVLTKATIHGTVSPPSALEVQHQQPLRKLLSLANGDAHRPELHTVRTAPIDFTRPKKTLAHEGVPTM